MEGGVGRGEGEEEAIRRRRRRRKEEEEEQEGRTARDKMHALTFSILRSSTKKLSIPTMRRCSLLEGLSWVTIPQP